jgi:hypothetical protein
MFLYGLDLEEEDVEKMLKEAQLTNCKVLFDYDPDEIVEVG